jgi:hypothetical protein
MRIIYGNLWKGSPIGHCGSNFLDIDNTAINVLGKIRRLQVCRGRFL